MYMKYNSVLLLQEEMQLAAHALTTLLARAHLLEVHKLFVITLCFVTLLNTTSTR